MKDPEYTIEEATFHARRLLGGLQTHVGDVPLDEWLANVSPFTKLEVDVLSIESMVIVARTILRLEDDREAGE